MNTSKKSRKYFAAFALSSALLAISQNSFAGSASGGTLNPVITLESTCTASITPQPTFGTYPTTNPDLIGVSAGSVAVTCSDGLRYAILLGGGLNYDSGDARRRLTGTNPANVIKYRILYAGADVGDVVLSFYPSYDAGYTPTAPGQNAIYVTGNGSEQSFPLTANIFITSSSKVVDNYTDTVAVLVQLP